ncbi:MAG TPA: FdtA/QdtA family cupin domain-containing protein [Bacteroidales bacterium]|nr:FdtA/QdtA family cupin domain-containing protein [Bacteroidales bacterium]
MDINSDKPLLINLPKIEDLRGNLSFIEEENHIPFKIKRVYWIYDVPGGEQRGGHAFKEQKEFVVALSGSFEVIIHNGENAVRYNLNRSYFGLYIPNGLWRHMENFSTNSVVLILSSTEFSETDYVRSFTEYLRFIANE